jgi:hypothetical protein
MPVPNLSPIEATPLVCTRCSNILRLTVQKNNNGSFNSLTYYCDTCQYGFKTTGTHTFGATAKYEAPVAVKEPEVKDVPKPEPEASEAHIAKKRGRPALHKEEVEPEVTI